MNTRVNSEWNEVNSTEKKERPLKGTQVKNKLTQTNK